MRIDMEKPDGDREWRWGEESGSSLRTSLRLPLRTWRALREKRFHAKLAKFAKKRWLC